MVWIADFDMRVGFYFKLGAHRAVTTRQYRTTVVTNGGPAASILSATLVQQFIPVLLPAITQPAVFQGVAIYQLSPIDALIEQAATLPIETGQGGVSPLPAQTAGLIRLYGSSGLTRDIGRMFIPYPSISDNGPDARPTAAYITALQTIAAFIPTEILAQDVGGIPPMLRTVRIRPTLRPRLTPPVANFVTGANVSDRWTNQRRRAVPPITQWSPFG